MNVRPPVPSSSQIPLLCAHLPPSRSVIVKTMLVALYAKENSLTNTTPLSEKGMSSLNYWRGHDMTTNNIAVTGTNNQIGSPP